MGQKLHLGLLTPCPPRSQASLLKERSERRQETCTVTTVTQNRDQGNGRPPSSQLSVLGAQVRTCRSSDQSPARPPSGEGTPGSHHAADGTSPCPPRGGGSYHRVSPWEKPRGLRKRYVVTWATQLQLRMLAAWPGPWRTRRSGAGGRARWSPCSSRRPKESRVPADPSLAAGLAPGGCSVSVQTKSTARSQQVSSDKVGFHSLNKTVDQRADNRVPSVFSGKYLWQRGTESRIAGVEAKCT